MSEINFASDFIGNSAVVRILSHAILHPAPAYVLTGVPHLGKKTLAEKFVRTLLQQDTNETWRNHPDIFILEAEEGKKLISVEQVRDVIERVSMRPFVASRIVVYVPNADLFNEAGTNALLKVVEEPPAEAVFVFVAQDIGRLPATLKSRAVVLPLYPVARKEMLRAGISEKKCDSARGRVGLAMLEQKEKNSAAGFVSAILKENCGSRLTRIDMLTKICDADEFPQLAWRDALQTMMGEMTEVMRENKKATVLGMGILLASRAIGTAISPRMYLDAIAIRLDGENMEESHRVMPKHISCGLPEVFL